MTNNPINSLSEWIDNVDTTLESLNIRLNEISNALREKNKKPFAYKGPSCSQDKKYIAALETLAADICEHYDSCSKCPIRSSAIGGTNMWCLKTYVRHAVEHMEGKNHV